MNNLLGISSGLVLLVVVVLLIVLGVLGILMPVFVYVISRRCKSIEAELAKHSSFLVDSYAEQKISNDLLRQLLRAYGHTPDS